MIRLVLSDMDGTLVSYNNTRVTPRGHAAIARLLDAGVRFGPSSGRDLASLLELFDGDEKCLRCGLVSNGKRVFLDGEVIHTTYLSPIDIECLVTVVRDVPGCYVSVSGDRRRMGDAHAVLGTSSWEFARTRWGRYDQSRVVESADFKVVGAGLFFDPDVTRAAGIDAEAVVSVARVACPNLDFVAPGQDLYDVLPKGWTKATGLNILCSAADIATTDVVAFGDSDNDLALLEAVGYPVAVRNANEVVRACCRYHIGFAEEDAVAGALEVIARAAERGEEVVDFS